MDSYKEKILKTIDNNKVTLIVSPTGTGKSTIIPSMLLNHYKNKRICLIQPRRLAVLNIYNYLKNKIKINYKIRHFKNIQKDSRLTIMTDGMFIKEILNSKNLFYDIIIIDEVHERSLRIEFIMMYLKYCEVFKVVLMSATVFKLENSKENSSNINMIDKENTNTGLENFFNPKKLILKIKSHKLQIFYEKEPVNDYILASYLKIKEIIQKEKNNPSRKDILVFLPGEEEIMELKEMLKRIGINGIPCLSRTIYDTVDLKENEITQCKKENKSPEKTSIGANSIDNFLNNLFKNNNTNLKVILSTNVAETSITIPNIKYVIDSGIQKIKIFKNDINYLGYCKISKESADQRTGRCNRIGMGICYRLYTQETYKNMENLKPEILKSDLCDFLLWISQIEMNVLTVNFISYPTRACVKKGISFLMEIGALSMVKNNEKKELKCRINKIYDKIGFTRNKNHIENENYFFRITNYGKKLLKYPFDTKYAHFLETSNKLKCGILAAKIISLISEENYNFLIKNDKMDIFCLLELMNSYLKYMNYDSDPIKKIDDFYEKDIIYDKIENEQNLKKDSNFISYLKEKKINISALKRAFLSFKQIQSFCMGNNLNNLEKAFSIAFKHNLSFFNDGSYKKGDEKVFVEPKSYFFKKRIKKIVFVDVVCKEKAYCRIVGRFIE